MITELKEGNINSQIDRQPSVKIVDTVIHNYFDRNVDKECDYTRFALRLKYRTNSFGGRRFPKLSK